ncbi:thymidine kinase (plasmid) [Pontibacillus sp. ALD_SL1]|uniref:thymidine kinase n=1 Tax=Pontibacillus sp. ALD_SL1 TaxID=2777185 RepID=UPI001A960DF1|nr:thymidine kinase [Pontibacillus sp. ALD_SL1]QST02905.1 thymidine kinase [Pontibacillus sp. ALD_SL1]
MIELITGCMYSGKTERFIERVHELKGEGKHILQFKPVQDDRYDKNDIVSHDGRRIKGLAVDGPDELMEIVEGEEPDCVAIDEVQFFGWDFVRVVETLANQGVHVLLAGLDQDFTGRSFGIMPDLMAQSDVMIKLNATCARCGDPASKSQRLVYGRPAAIYDPIVIVKEGVTYEPRCRKHHELVS